MLWRWALPLFGLALAAVALAVLLWPGAQDVPGKRAGVTLKIPGRKAIVLTPPQARKLGEGRWSLPMPGRRSIIKGSAKITYKFDRDGVRRELVSIAKSGGTVRVAERPVEVLVDAPIVKQVYPNNCETAALEMLLATKGVKKSQRELQSALRRDGPLDPRTASDGTKVWGNPTYGFVGRVEGGGAAGGFGVYEKPLAALASRWVEPVDLGGRSPAAIFNRLLNGHAVLVWIGLSAGPYETWRGPRGERVTVNYGEHTVLLRGLAGGSVLVNDPLSGESQLWSRREFKEKWALLGHRAISV